MTRLQRLQAAHKERVERLAELRREHDILLAAMTDATQRGDTEAALNWGRNLMDCEWDISQIIREL